MKYLALLLFTMFIATAAIAQPNHVPNCSFEEYTACPPNSNILHTIYYCKGWRQYNLYRTPYFNACNTSLSGVPVNVEGYQYPAHGNAYASVILMIGFGDDKSYLARKITPLFPGARYEVSMSVSLANSSGWACDGLGAYFYQSGPDTSVGGTLPVTPQILYPGVVKDTTANWVRLVKTFKADSAYDKIVIGGFLKPADTDYDTLNISGTWGITYYVDSVVVRLADSFYLNPTDSMYCAGDTVSIPFVALRTYAANNVFTVQLSDAGGSFTSPVNIGSVNAQSSGIVKCVFPQNTQTGTGYRLRFVASNIKDTALEYGRTFKIGNVTRPVATSNSPLCITDTLKLFASTPTPGVTYSWRSSGGSLYNEQNPKVYPLGLSNNGDYVVTASLYGCKIKDTTTVAISSNSLVHDFAKSNSPVCTDDTLRLFSGFSLAGVVYSWSGPGGFMSSQQNNILPGTSVANGGAYILTVTNGGCVVKDTVNVVVTARPAAVIATAGSPCTNEALQLSVSSAFGSYSYTWSGPSGFTSSSASPVVNNATTANIGDYYVSGSYMGCVLKDTVAVYVKPFPAKPVANNDLVLCSGQTINLTSSSVTTGVSYSWTGPASYTSNIQNPIISNSTTGMTGAYIVTTDLNGCKTTDTANVTVKPSPTPVLLSSNSPQCVGSTLLLNSTASTGVSYTWTGPGAFNAGTQNTGIANSTVSATGWYKMTVELNGCTYTDSISAVVHPIPATPVVNHSSPLCAGETLQLSTAVVNGASYSWTGVNGFNANVQNPQKNNVLVMTDAGQYEVVVTVNGCSSAPGRATVAINPNPFVVIHPAVPVDTICQGDAVTFVALPTNTGLSPQYKWLVNGQQTGTGITFSISTLNKGDVVSCEMTDAAKCNAPYTDRSNDISLEVLPWLAPAVSVTASPNRTLQLNEYVTFTATPVNGGINPTYQWKRNGQNVIGATGSTWSANTLNDNDKISVEMISSYKCPQPKGAGSNAITVRVSGTGVNNFEMVHDLQLYPNPNNGRFLLQGRVAVDDNLQLAVINAVGQVVHKETAVVKKGQVSIEVNAGGIPAGAYMVQISNSDGVQRIKMIVQ